MEVVLKQVNELIPYVNNTRTHSDGQVQQIASSIKEFGFTNPVLLDEKDGIIAGHGRVMAAKLLQLDEVPTITLKGLTEAQVKAYIIADNKLALNAGWDEELLKLEIEALGEMNFNIDLLGFSLEELDDLGIGDIDLELDTDKADDVPELEENPVIKLGDLIELGHNYQHRLLCGDSTSEENINIVLDGNKADLVLTDPPYRYAKMGDASSAFGKGANNFKERIKDIVDFNPDDFLCIMPSVLNGNMNTYIFCNTALVPDYLNFAVKNKYNFNILTWHKKSFLPVTGTHHYPDTEYLIYISKKAIFNTGIKEAIYSKYFVMDNEKHKDHPTIKPIELLENEMLISSNKNSIVFDFFGGSGSTMIACENLQRRCRMIELSEQYAQVIIQRYVDYTSIDTIKINGKEVSWSEYKEDNS